MSGACRSLLVEVGGVLFLLLFRPLHDSLATENDCSGNDGAGKLFWGIKKTSVPVVSWWQLSFLAILSVNANANMLSASR